VQTTRLFCDLFNALTPGRAIHLGIQSLPSIRGYGPTQVKTHRQDRRTVTQKSIDALVGSLTFLSRRHSYPLKAGYKMGLSLYGDDRLSISGEIGCSEEMV